MDAVVKVYCIHTEPNYSLPFRELILNTNAFVRACACVQVKVKKRGDDRTFLARVLSMGVDCDIALLTVDDPAFWEEVVLLAVTAASTLTSGPPVVSTNHWGGHHLCRACVQVKVKKRGWCCWSGALWEWRRRGRVPHWGDTISVTAGVVSRIEVTDYSHGSTDLLAIQIDAAINGGNSGGPVFNKRCECVGIAFQALVGEDVENVGYVIPTPVVQHFLTDYKRSGGFSGFPALGLQWQRMESDALRRSFLLGPKQKGVLVRNVNPTTSLAGVLLPDDILMCFDDIVISSDGTVPFRSGERIAFSYLISQKFVGDSCKLDILRAGKPLTLNVVLSKPKALIPPHISNADPSYLIVGGLVFTVCLEPYLLSEYGSDYGTDSPVKLLERLYHGFPKAKGEEVVVLSQVLASEATLGYEDIYNVQLLRFNGVAVMDLQHLSTLVAGCNEQYMRFDLEYNEVVVIETSAVQACTPEVMAAHSIPFPVSRDLRKALPEAA
ncbi:MAG: hypothetical protein WDW38_008405 [Sanguina aurantia]